MKRILLVLKRIFKADTGKFTQRRRTNTEAPAYIEDFVLAVTLVIEKVNKGKMGTIKAYEELLKVFLEHHKIRS